VAHRAIGPGSLVASRFRLEDLLEENAGARFWRATDLTLVRSVAVHVIARDDPRAPAVLTAARTSATVSDPRILRVLDAVEEDDLVHVVHEWGSGVSLDRLLAGETMEPRRAAWLVREVAEAIAGAHRHGIAHGRLIPENVLLTDVGSVKLIGFVVDAVLHGRAQPEGAVGEPPSEHESDVLNLGALLYACLTGKWAGFPGSALPAAPHDHDRVCRPRQVRPGIPKQLDTLCDQILNRSPRGGRRYESAADVCTALGDYLGDTLSTAAVDVTDATAFLDPSALSGARPPGSRDSAGTHGSSNAVPGPPTPRGTALDDTQPGLPALHREPAAASPHPPTTWPTDRGDPEPPVEGDPDRRPGSVSLRLAALLGVLALVLVGVLLWPLLSGSDEPGDDESAQHRRSRDTSAPTEVVQPAAVDDFDPDGGEVPEENSDMVPLATDGNPNTAWETKTYFDGPVLAPYRSGVGLLLDLGEETEVGEVEVTLEGGPYDLEVMAAPKGAARPTTTDGLTSVEARSGVSGEIALRGSDTVLTRYVVVWLTSLPRSTDGYRGGIAEVVVRS
jgi:serine/threonine protein kinase